MLTINSKSLVAAGLISAMAFLGTPAQGSLLVHEGFDYTPGVYVASDLTGGMGFSAAWYDHVGNTLEFPITGGGFNGAYFDASGGVNSPQGEWRSRNYTAVGNQSEGTIVWASLTMSNGGTDGGSVRVENSSGGMQARIRIETSGTYSLFGGHIDTVSDASSIVATTDATIHDLVVFRFVNTANANEQTASVWINPTAGSEGGLGTPDMTVTYTSFQNNRNLGQFTIQAGSLRVDELKVGTSYESVFTVIPEPASLALVGIGGLLLMLRRRRA